jgi:hypothetical protein
VTDRTPTLSVDKLTRLVASEAIDTVVVATVAEAALGCLGHAGRSDVLRVLLTRRGDTSRAR